MKQFGEYFGLDWSFEGLVERNDGFDNSWAGTSAPQTKNSQKNPKKSIRFNFEVISFFTQYRKHQLIFFLSLSCRLKIWENGE
jgi:hypothetical protein